jgi:hypothetical protein
MPPALYVLLCLIVPFVWGLLSARLFDAVQRRMPARTEPNGDESPDMYHI